MTVEGSGPMLAPKVDRPGGFRLPLGSPPQSVGEGRSLGTLAVLDFGGAVA